MQNRSRPRKAGHWSWFAGDRKLGRVIHQIATALPPIFFVLAFGYGDGVGDKARSRWFSVSRSGP